MLATINNALERMYMSLNPVYRNERALMSRQLEEFRNLNFGAMVYELAKLFDSDKELMAKGLRVFNVVGKSCDDIAIQHDVPAQRRFSDVSETMAKRWTEIYAELGVNDCIAEGERQTVAQQCMVYGFWPDSKNVPRLTRFLTFQVESVVFDDPWAAAAGDLQDAARVVLLRPAFMMGDSYQPGAPSQFVARVVLERNWAFYEMPNGTRHGLFNPSMTNPLGFVPLAGTRTALPIDDTDWLPEVAQDMWSVSVGASLGATDMEHIVRQDVPIMTYASGIGAKAIASRIKKLPGGLVPIPAETQLTPNNTTPAIEKYALACDRTLTIYAQMRDLRPEGYSGLTGNAKQVDKGALEQRRLKQENRLRKLERSLKRLIARVHVLTQRAALTLEEPTLDVTFVYPRTRENVLQEAQALPLLMAMGLADSVEDIATNEKVSLEEAERRWKQRLKRWSDMRGGGVLDAPGLDKISGQLDKNAPKVSTDTAPTDASIAADKKPVADAPAKLDVAPGANVQASALNGAQVASLQAIVVAAAKRELPLESAREMIIASFPIDPADVEKMLAPLKSFELPKQEAPDAGIGEGRDLEAGA